MTKQMPPMYSRKWWNLWRSGALDRLQILLIVWRNQVRENEKVFGNALHGWETLEWAIQKLHIPRFWGWDYAAIVRRQASEIGV